MRSRTRVLLAALLALSFASFGLAAPESAPDPAELLKSTLAEPDIPYVGRMMVTRWYGKRTRSEEVKVYHGSSNRYRWEFISPNGSVNRMVVSDGSVEELRLPQKRQVLRGDAIKSLLKVMSENRERELLLKNYSPTLAGEDRVVGRPAWILELTPTVEGKPHQRLLIDRETRVILENRRYHPKEPNAVLTRFNRFEPRANPPEDLFTLSQDSGASVDAHGLDPDFMSIEDLNRAVGKSGNFPTELPAGFVFESADFFKVGDATVRHLRYTDGLIVLSLFQTDRPVRFNPELPVDYSSQDAVPGSLRLSSSGRVLYWRQGRRYYTLIGDVARPLLQRISTQLKQSET